MIVEAALKEKKQAAEDTFELTFKIQNGAKINFLPGQYIWLILPKLKFSDPKGERRAFSISSSCAKQDIISILFRASDSGYKKTLLSLPIGAKVKIRGPHGQSFVVDKNVGRNACFIAGGMGIAPFLGILRSYAHLSFHPAITLVYLRQPKEQGFLSDELTQLAAKNKIKIIVHVGIFDRSLIQQIPPSQPTTYFICGPQNMINDVWAKLSVAGVPDASMRFEQYYPAAKNPIFDQALLDGKKKINIDQGDAREMMLGSMLVYYCLVAAMFSGAIGLYYSFSGIPLVQNSITYIAFFASFACYLFYKFSKNLKISSHGAVAISMILILLALYQGMQMGAAIYSLYLFPFVAFFFSGTAGGAVWIAVYIASISLIYAFSSAGLTPFHYRPSEIISSLASIGFGSILIFLISSLYGKLQNRLNRSNAFKNAFQSVYRFAVESSTNHTIITDTNGIIIYANRAAQEATGYAFSEMQGNTPRLWGGNMSPDFYRGLWEKKKMWRDAKILGATGPFIGEIKNTKKNGAHYVAFTRISPIINEMGIVIGYTGTEEDITRRLKLEEELKLKAVEAKREQMKDEATLQSIGEGILALDTRERVTLINKKAEEMLGFSVANFRGKTFSGVLAAETENGNSIPPEKRVDRVALRVGETKIQDCVYRRKDGSKFLAHVTAAPVIVDKKIFGVVVIIRDITKEREVDKAKTEFISVASHQLRTPLSAINWYAEILLSGDAGKINKSQREYLREIYAGNLRMVELVNSLLDVSRLEMGAFPMENSPTDVTKLAQNVAGELQPAVAAKKLKIKQQYGKHLPSFSADPKLLRIILQNLLSNAIKYTPKNGRVTLDIHAVQAGETIGGKAATEPSMVFIVSDTGCGIPENQQHKIFTKLFRADNVRQLDTTGTGLGLYITKTIIDHSGGKIWFASEENRGTAFYATFPLGGMKAEVAK